MNNNLSGLFKAASVLPYLAATGGPGTAYYNEGGDLGLVASYNKAPLGNMNFYDQAYFTADAASWLAPGVLPAKSLKVAKSAKLISKPVEKIKKPATEWSISYGPELAGEGALQEISGVQAPRGIVGKTIQSVYNNDSTKTPKSNKDVKSDKKNSLSDNKLLQAYLLSKSSK